MEFEIVFCTDGILRVKYGKKPMIPAKFIHSINPKYKSDLGFWSCFWEEYTYFEDGLTVSQFFSCLEPWAIFFQELTHKNIQAFINELKKPVLVKNQKDENEHPITWVSLSYQTDIQLKMKFEPSEEINNDFMSWFNKKHNAKLTGDWSVHGAYKLTGYSKGYEEQYSVDHTPMAELANLPLVLESKHIVIFPQTNEKKILGEDYKMFNDNSFGIRSIKHNDEYQTSYIQSKKLHRFREVIEGFFWWFPKDPTSREEFNNLIKDSVTSIEENELLDESLKTEMETNVTPLFKKDKEQVDKEEPTDNDENKIKQIIIAPGAFDSIIKQADSNNLFWEDLLEKSKNSHDTILKIGEFKKGKAPENRVYSYIIQPEDLSTPYKGI